MLNQSHTAPNLVRFGDNIQSGSYRLHSRFEKVTNYISGKTLISLVNEEVGAGPVNIVLSGLDLSNVDSIEITTTHLHTPDVSFHLDGNKRYQSKLDINNVQRELFEANLLSFEKALIQLSSPDSLSFLLKNNTIEPIDSNFKINISKTIKRGSDLIFKGDLISGVQTVKGVGFGLTPSGDDFLCGILWGFHLIREINEQDMNSLMTLVYKNALSHNIISNTMFYLAKEGMFVETVKMLLKALLYEDTTAVFRMTGKLVQIGKTSGADSGTGLLKALRCSRFTGS